LILGGEFAMLQAPMFDGLLFDPFSLFEDDPAPFPDFAWLDCPTKTSR
jgi:hypothetical protein